MYNLNCTVHHTIIFYVCIVYVGLNLNIEDLYQAGIFTRNLNTYGVLFQMLVKHYRFGYVFEFPASQASSLRFTSHELTLGVSLGVLDFHDRGKLKFQ